MELRLDRLLPALHDAAAVLGTIDRDPLLTRRTCGPLILANAAPALYAPQAEHQLFAKGVVYRRDPYRLVSLPLVKIYNLGERDVTAAGLAELAGEPGVRVHFLRKIDGSLVQVFRHDGRAWFTTRGRFEGDDGGGFDHAGTARRLAAERHPRLLDAAALPDGRTLVFELIHPQARKITDYGPRAELVLLACFDIRRLAYLPYAELTGLAAEYGLPVVDAWVPAGADLAGQIDGVLAGLADGDQEGCVLQFENAREVIHRVKVKSPAYLRRLGAAAECTYERLAVLMDAHPHWTGWPDVEAFLKVRGRGAVPEEMLPFYRRHHERFAAYVADCECLLRWATRTHADIVRQLGGKDSASHRKRFAALATRYPHSPLLFAALDGRLDGAGIRRLIRTPEEARQAVRDLGLSE